MTEILLGIVAVVAIVFVYFLVIIGFGLFATWLNECDKEAERLAADEQAARARKEVA